jgi:hypothetical protein
LEAIPIERRDTANTDVPKRGEIVRDKRRIARRTQIPRKTDTAVFLPIFSDRGVDEVESAYESMGSA